MSTIRLVELAGGDIDEALKFVRARTSVETVRALLASRIDQAIAAKPHLKHLANVEPQAANGSWDKAVAALNTREP